MIENPGNLGMNFEKARLNMVEQQIRPWEVLDQRVLDAILNSPREAFVPRSRSDQLPRALGLRFCMA